MDESDCLHCVKAVYEKKSSSRFDTNMNRWLQDMQIHNYPHLTA